MCALVPTVGRKGTGDTVAGGRRTVPGEQGEGRTQGGAGRDDNRPTQTKG